MFTISEDLLAKVIEAVQAGEKQARTSGTIQSFEIFYHGFRANLCFGRIYVVPASICSDRKDFPTALLYGCLVKEFGGEEIGDMIEKKIGESEFDEYSQADFDTIKEKLFGVGDGKFESLILFAPTWWNKREYIAFKFTKDETQLKNCLRHQVFAAYYDPRLSSAFNAIMTNVNTTKLDVTDITPKLPFPFLAENLLTQYPDLQKQAGNKKKIFLNHRTADAVTKEVLDPQELDVFESLNQALSEALVPSTETAEEAGEEHHDEGGFDVPRVAAKRVEECPGCGKTRTLNDAGICRECAKSKSEAQKSASIEKVAYVAHVPGHKNSEGESAPWVIKDHDGGKILSSHKTETEAKSHLQDMHAHAGSSEAFGGKQAPPFGSEKKDEKEASAETKKEAMSYESMEALAESRHEKKCKTCHAILMGNEARSDRCNKCLDKAAKKSKDACVEPAAHETPITNVGPGTEAATAQEGMVKAVKEHVETQEGEPPIGVAIDETGVPRRKEEEQKVSSDKEAAITKNRSRTGKRYPGTHPDAKRLLPASSPKNLGQSYSRVYSGGFADKHSFPPKDVRDYINKTTTPNAQPHHAMLDHAAEIDAGKWGPTPTLKTAAQQIKADFIAEHIAADFEEPYEVISPKAKKARDEREDKLSKLRPKQADVALDIDSIWAEITEDMGPAPLVDVDVPGETTTQPEGSSDGRPNKKDVGELPEAFKSDEPEDDKAMSDSEADAQEDSMPEAKQEHDEPESDKPWQVSSSMEDFVKEAADELESDAPKFGCDQCEMLMINGIPCHELGCPNGKKTWVPEKGWVRYNQCPECGSDVEEGEPCNCNEFLVEEEDVHLSAKDDKECDKAKRVVREVKEVVKKADTADNAVDADKGEAPTKETGESPTVQHHKEYDKQQSKGAGSKTADTADNPYNWKDGEGAPEDKKNAVKADTSGPDVKSASKKTAKPSWKMRLQDSYDGDFEQWEMYDRTYNLAQRLGFRSAREAWEANPVIQGSVDPADFSVVAADKSASALGTITTPKPKKPIDNVGPSDGPTGQKLADGIQKDLAEAKAESVSPDTTNSNTAPETTPAEDLRSKTATGEMTQAELDASGREEWPLHYAIADALGGVVRPFDQYQGPYVTFEGKDIRQGREPYAVAPRMPGIVRLWISVDDGDLGTVYNEENEKTSQPFDLNSPQEAIAAAEEVLGGEEPPATKTADEVQPDVAEAKSETVSPDTVDNDIHQETKSVSEAAKVAVGLSQPDEKIEDAEVEISAQPKPLEDRLREQHEHEMEMAASKKATDVSGDMAEAKAETESPDTVDPSIKQETKSVPEAAKVSASEIPAAQGETESGKQPVSNLSDGAPEALDVPAILASEKTADLNVQEQEEDALNGICPRCGGSDAEPVEAEDGKRLYCHDCGQVTWTFGKNAAAGDNLPEEIPIDFGAGDLADIVMSEEPEAAEDK